MAKVKTAKQRISDFLKEKGLDATGVKDAFDELDAADVDLEKLADATLKNSQWVEWYQTVVPQVQEAMTERETLKAQIAKLEAAGFKLEGAANPATTQNTQLSGPGQYVSPEQFKTYESNLTKATSDIMKKVALYGFRHFKQFNEEPDYDAIEKLMGEKSIPFDMAYDSWVQPKRDAAREKDVEEKIKRGIQEGMQAERSKLGISRTRKKTDDIDVAPLSEVANNKENKGPSNSELREAFLKDLDSTADGVTH